MKSFRSSKSTKRHTDVRTRQSNDMYVIGSFDTIQVNYNVVKQRQQVIKK